MGGGIALRGQNFSGARYRALSQWSYLFSWGNTFSMGHPLVTPLAMGLVRGYSKEV